MSKQKTKITVDTIVIILFGLLGITALFIVMFWHPKAQTGYPMMDEMHTNSYQDVELRVFKVSENELIAGRWKMKELTADAAHMDVTENSFKYLPVEDMPVGSCIDVTADVDTVVGGVAGFNEVSIRKVKEKGDIGGGKDDHK